MLTPLEDAYGQLVHQYHQGLPVKEIVERDDGFIAVSGGPENYFAPLAEWPDHERRAVRFAKGRVLDVGAGAGRVSLHLQDRGSPVLAIDNSPLAVEVCRSRGVRRAEVMPVTAVSRRLGEFDTIVMFGNNFGLMESTTRARWLLRRFAAMTPRDGRIVAATVDPYGTDDPVHRRYHRRNRQRGRMGGQVRIRVRHGVHRTPWFDYLLASRPELERLVRGTAWRVSRTIDSPGPAYAVVLEKRET